MPRFRRYGRRRFGRRGGGFRRRSYGSSRRFSKKRSPYVTVNKLLRRVAYTSGDDRTKAVDRLKGYVNGHLVNGAKLMSYVKRKVHDEQRDISAQTGNMSAINTFLPYFGMGATLAPQGRQFTDAYNGLM